jgi:hypothetical protein
MMSEIFWISRGEFSGPNFILQDAVLKGGIQPAWLQMIHWIGSDPGLPLVGSSAIALAWNHQPGISAFLIHDTCRSILLRELNLVLLVEQSPAGNIDQVVLASPVGIGQHNLFPRAHLAAWWAVPTSGLGMLSLWLERSGYNPLAVRFLAGEKDLVAQAGASFPESSPIEKQPETTVGKLNALVSNLMATRSELGLLLSPTGGSTVLVTLVEL